MLVKVSFRDMSKQEITTKIRSLNVEYMKMIKEICDELQTETPWKQLPVAFFKGMPVTIRNKYEATVTENRRQFRELAFIFRNLKEQYEDKNPTFYRKDQNPNLFKKKNPEPQEAEPVEV